MLSPAREHCGRLQERQQAIERRHLELQRQMPSCHDTHEERSVAVVPCTMPLSGQSQHFLLPVLPSSAAACVVTPTHGCLGFDDKLYSTQPQQNKLPEPQRFGALGTPATAHVILTMKLMRRQLVMGPSFHVQCYLFRITPLYIWICVTHLGE